MVVTGNSKQLLSRLHQGLQKPCHADMDDIEKSKMQKGDFVRENDKKYLELGFANAPSIEKVPCSM